MPQKHPSRIPRLVDLQADLVRDEVLAMVRRHLDRMSALTDLVGAAFRVPSLTDIQDTYLARTIIMLVQYAQTGECALNTDLNAHIRPISELLRQNAWNIPLRDRDGWGPCTEGGSQPETSIGTVLLACWTRNHLVQGLSVPSRALATLSSCATQTVGQAIRDGALHSTAGLIPAHEAIGWAVEHGVSGLPEVSRAAA